ncbi:MAG: 23S rRNA (guanosine(2251)-2'-O)-methyltransferase RlmB, partial [Bdellovibrionales bacterium]|nr:23S rRNA (guanosine(2251)-2'-O)-methyltransferase RlmB [Bdellovibrionales bacterium]
MSYYVMGRNSVREVLTNCPERVAKLLVKSDDTNQQLAELLEQATQLGLPVKECTKDQLEKLLQSGSHQSIALELHQSPEHDFKTYKKKLAEASPGLVLALDGIEDPHNFGAIIRAAECFQVTAVLWSSNRGTGLTPTVTKVSSGGTELIPLVHCKNLRTALSALKELGYWVAATTISENSQSLYQFEFPEKTALVIGAEHRGVSQLIADESDFQIMIPMLGKIDSVNVS